MSDNQLLLENIPDDFDLNRPKWSGFFKVVEPATKTMLQTDSQSVDGSSLYANSNWYQFVTYGSAARLNRYREYDLMDGDCDITRALDIIAEEMCGNLSKNSLPFVLDMSNDSQMPKNSHYVVALTAALRKWCDIQSFSTRMFPTNRKTIKYGDCFYKKKSPLEKWIPLSPKQVIGAIVDKDDVTKVVGWQIQKNIMAAHGSETIGNYQVVGSEQDQSEYEILNASEVVRFCVNTELADVAPFGESVLQSVYRTFRQKQLLEDAILIYRITRAPERLVFNIDTSGMQPHRIQQYLEKVKNDMNQKMIPSPNASGGIESTYNPSSSLENYYFAKRENGIGSTVEQLPGGCLSMDTTVPLLDGRTLNIQELSNEYQQGIQNWAYSCDPSTGEVVPGLISWAGVTHEEAEVYEMELDNGEIIIATPDHKFPVWGKGSSIELQDIEIGDSLIHFETQQSPLGQREYQQVYQHDTKKWQFTHRMVRSYFDNLGETNNLVFQQEGSFNVIHHINGDALDNTPSNLVNMNRNDHFLLHATKAREIQPLAVERVKFLYANNEEYKQNNSNNLSIIREKFHTTVKSDHIKHKKWTDSISKAQTDRISKMSSIEKDVFISNSKQNLLLATPASLAWRKNNPNECKQMHIRIGENLSKALRTDGPIREQAIAHCHAIHQPCTNTSYSFSDDMLTIVRYLFDQGNIEINQLLSVLNKTYEFMTIWENLNNEPSVGNKFNKIKNYVFKCQHLDALIKHYGFNNWEDFKYQRLSLTEIKPDVFKQFTSTMTVEKVTLLRKLIDLVKITPTVDKLKRSIDDHTKHELYNLFNVINNYEYKMQMKSKLDHHHFDKFAMVLGFRDFKDFLSKKALFNHRVVRVTKLPNKIQVGTLTIDQKEKYHAHHNFALSVGVFTKNSSLGVLDDLVYFEKKTFRGLRVPLSYIQAEADNPAVFNDGKIGLAYVEETKFSQYCERLQADQEYVFDKEFKEFVTAIGLTIDPLTYRIILPPPTNFGVYRELELNTELLGALTQADSVTSISKRFAMKEFLNWNEAKIAMNEQWKRQELGLKQNDPTAFRKIYDAAASGEDSDIGGGSFRDLDSSFGGHELDAGDTDENPNLINANDEGNLNAGSGDQLGSSNAEK